MLTNTYLVGLESLNEFKKCSVCYANNKQSYLHPHVELFLDSRLSSFYYFHMRNNEGNRFF